MSSPIVSICTDYVALQALEGLEELKGTILGRCGAFVYKNADATQSIAVLSATNGLESLALLPYITLTSYEAIFGYKRQVVLDGIPQVQTVEVDGEDVLTPLLETVPADSAMKTLYDGVYDQSPIVTEEGTYTPSPILYLPSGWDSSHITL